jgi:Ala-tRNA(Pro) deacylase
MGMALKLQQYLDDRGIAYDLTKHTRTATAAQTAHASHISGHCLAKAVVLKRKDGYVLAVVPASRRVELESVGRWLDRPVSMATEEEIATLFPDCDIGAIPPIGAAYGLETIVDDSFDNVADIYFEAGDHRSLVHISDKEFHNLMTDCRYCHISGRV